VGASGRVEHIVVDGRSMPIDAAVDLTPGSRNLQIDYTALSFRTPERITFKYRLEGYDRDWIAARQPTNGLLHEPVAGQFPLPCDRGQ